MKWAFICADMGGDFELAQHMVGKLKITWDFDPSSRNFFACASLIVDIGKARVGCFS